MYTLEFPETTFESDGDVGGSYVKITDKTEKVSVEIPLEELELFVRDSMQRELLDLRVKDSRHREEGG